MEDLGYRVLTAQNGPEVLSIERAVSRFTDLVMPHGISGGEAAAGLFSKNVAGRRRRPAERAAKLRAVRASVRN
jgi:CheY-like chemotaxis protein